MKIAIVFVYAGEVALRYENYTQRFLHSYHQNPPGCDHDTVVVLNGAKASSEITCMFSLLPNCRFIEHDGSGYDIGGYQLAARSHECDMMVFFGGSTYFTRAGWLLRMAGAFQTHGNAQYGVNGNRGNLDVKVWPHIRTTGFWMHPELMNSYPKIITRPEERHPFEHGSECFTEWVKKCGLKSWVVTWNRELLWEDWDSDPNGYHRGNQNSILAGDRMCERPYYPANRCRGNPAEFCEPWKRERCFDCLTTT